MKHVSPIFLTIGFLLIFAIPAAGQDSPVAATSTARIEALDSLLSATRTKEAEVERLRQQVQNARDGRSRENGEADLSKALEELEYLRDRFTESAAMVDISPFKDRVDEPFSWEQALGKILEPVIAEVEAASAQSRKAALLKEEVATYSLREDVAANALDRIQQTLRQVEPETPLAEALQKEENLWAERLSIARNQANAARIQLEEFNASRGGILDSATPYIRAFLTQRGLNLVIGIGAALIVFFSIRLLLSFLRRVRKHSNPNTLSSRLFDLTTNLLSVFASVAALLIAFSAAGDLFLLGIVLIFLIGAAWAGIQVIPQFIESLKIILNVGMVKEGQRLLFDEVPWNVESLGFSCSIRNPYLENAVLDLPVRRLVGLHSRPWCVGETPFPTQKGDCIRFSDGTFGQIVSQTPSVVSIREPGGAVHSFATPEFILRQPINLSLEGFRITASLSLAQNELSLSLLEKIPDLEKAVASELSALVDPSKIALLRISLHHLDSSALHLLAELDFNGSEAPRYVRLKHATQQALLTIAVRNNLSLPSQKVDLHTPSGT